MICIKKKTFSIASPSHPLVFPKCRVDAKSSASGADRFFRLFQWQWDGNKVQIPKMTWRYKGANVFGSPERYLTSKEHPFETPGADFRWFSFLWNSIFHDVVSHVWPSVHMQAVQVIGNQLPRSMTMTMNTTVLLAASGIILAEHIAVLDQSIWVLTKRAHNSEWKVKKAEKKESDEFDLPVVLFRV